MYSSLIDAIISRQVTEHDTQVLKFESDRRLWTLTRHGLIFMITEETDKPRDRRVESIAQRARRL